MSSEGRHLNRLPGHRDVVRPERRRRVRERGEPRRGIRGVARPERHAARVIEEVRDDPAVGAVVIRSAARVADHARRQRHRKAASGLDLESDEAIRSEHRRRGVRLRRKERASRRLVDARRVGEARDEGEREGVLLHLDLGAAHRRVDSELVNLAHRQRQTPAELRVRVADGDLEARRRVSGPELRGIDGVFVARLVVPKHFAADGRSEGEACEGRVVHRPPPVQRGVEPQPRRPLSPAQRGVEAVDPSSPAAVLLKLVVALVEVLRHDGRLGDVELDALAADVPHVDGARGPRAERPDRRAHEERREEDAPDFHERCLLTC